MGEAPQHRHSAAAQETATQTSPQRTHALDRTSRLRQTASPTQVPTRNLSPGRSPISVGRARPFRRAPHANARDASGAGLATVSLAGAAYALVHASAQGWPAPRRYPAAAITAAADGAGTSCPTPHGVAAPGRRATSRWAPPWPHCFPARTTTTPFCSRSTCTPRLSTERRRRRPLPAGTASPPDAAPSVVPLDLQPQLKLHSRVMATTEAPMTSSPTTHDTRSAGSEPCDCGCTCCAAAAPQRAAQQPRISCECSCNCSTGSECACSCTADGCSCGCAG